MKRSGFNFEQNQVFIEKETPQIKLLQFWKN